MKQLIILLSVFLFSCSDSEVTGKIVKVIDGDTFIFQTSNKQFRVRMCDIDAPELGQVHGPKSKDFLQRYLNKHAQLICKGKDRYNRTLATLYIDGVNINELSIKLGQAWYTEKFSNNDEYFYLQEAARILKLGLWAYDTCPPWIYRKQYKH